MVTSFIVASIASQVVPRRFQAGDPNADAWIMLITVGITTVVWITVTFLTRPEPDSVLLSFYRRVRPGGPGWRRIALAAGLPPEPIAGGKTAWLNWIAGVVAVYATLFGIGKIVFGELTRGLILLAIAAVAFGWISRSLRQTSPTAGAAAATE